MSKLTLEQILNIVVGESRNSCSNAADAYNYIASHYSYVVDHQELKKFLRILNFAAIREEYPPPAVPEPKFAVDTMVDIVRSGNTFDTYYAWPDREKYVPHFEYGNTPCNGERYTITHVGQHEDSHLGELYVLDGRFIVGDAAFVPVR